MGLIDFIKDAGEKILDVLTPGNAQADTVPDVQATLKKHIENVGLGNPDIQTQLQGSTLVVTGNVGSQQEKEKILVTLGNIQGVEQVDDRLVVSGGAPAAKAARLYTVQAGDTLSKIAKQMYSDANQYQKIFNANEPMLKSPDKIYPGQVLRIPE